MTGGKSLDDELFVDATKKDYLGIIFNAGEPVIAGAIHASMHNSVEARTCFHRSSPCRRASDRRLDIYTH